MTKYDLYSSRYIYSLCEIDDELKAIYHSKDSVCIWVFGSREDRNNFSDKDISRENKIIPMKKLILVRKIILVSAI